MFRIRLKQCVQIGAVSAAVLIGQAAQAEEPAIEFHADRVVASDNVILHTIEGEDPDAVDRGMFWIGVSCAPLPDALKTQLAIKEGLLVEDVRGESPASKAGIHTHDILIRLGEHPLTSIEQLAEEVNRLGSKEVDVLLMRGGKEQTVKLMPAERPKDVAVDTHRVAEVIYSKVLGEHVKPQDVRMLLVRPGVVLPPGHAKTMDLPEGVSITVRKESDKPAKIEVKRGDKTWSVTEDKLDELPEDLRPLVEQMKGHSVHFSMPHDLRDVKADRTLRVHAPPPATARMTVKPLPPGVTPAMPARAVAVARSMEAGQPQLAELSRKLDQVLEAVQKPSEVEALQQEVKQLRQELEQLRKQIEK